MKAKMAVYLEEELKQIQAAHTKHIEGLKKEIDRLTSELKAERDNHKATATAFVQFKEQTEISKSKIV